MGQLDHHIAKPEPTRSFRLVEPAGKTFRRGTVHMQNRSTTLEEEDNEETCGFGQVGQVDHYVANSAK